VLCCAAHAPRRQTACTYSDFKSAGLLPASLTFAFLEVCSRFLELRLCHPQTSNPCLTQVHDWLSETLAAGQRVGIDPAVHTIEAAEKLRQRLAAAGIQLVTLDTNLVDAVWGAERPPPPEVRCCESGREAWWNNLIRCC
jgi:hypothetical protein